jgi:hypothetical protein
MSIPRSSRLDLGGEEDALAAAIVRLVDQALEARLGRAITAGGRVRAGAITGILASGSGGTGTATGIRPHPIDLHTNVEITDPQPGQVLVYYLDGFWRNADFAAAGTPGALTVAGMVLTVGGELLTVG